MTVSGRALSLVPCGAFIGIALAAVGCGGASTATTAPVSFSASLGFASVAVAQDGAPVTLPVNVAGPAGTPTVTVSGLPSGITEQFTPVSGGPSGTLTFTGGPAVAAGNYAAVVTVSLAGQTATLNLTVIGAVVAKVGAVVDTTLGVNGVLKQFMSTSFQIAEWSGDPLGPVAVAAARESQLTALGPQHIRLQALSEAIPMKANSGASSDWDFTLLDETVQPVLASADHNPEFQIAAAPAWMCDSNGQLDITNHLQDFAAYAANLVRYYNKGGFVVGGEAFQSASANPITWWGILNEPDYNGITAAQYVTIYDAVVPAMLAVDPTIKFSALEFAGSSLGTGWPSDPEVYLPAFFAPANAGGVQAQVDAVSNHFYSSCNQKDTDSEIFNTIPQFVAVENYLYKELKTRADLANVPVWTTENNVNADYASASAMSSCNPTQAFVTDPRGTSAFFAAWRPYVFSQLGKAGNQALYHWSYAGDAQYGETDGNGNYYLSYWVDKTLESLYPSTASSPGPEILSISSTDTSSVETLATRNANGTVTVMVVDHAVHSASDDNGSGDSRTVVVDLSNFSAFYAASLLTIDGATSIATGPAGAGVTPGTRMNVTLPGYGVAFLTLTP
jgi:hypothetical protein